MQFFNQSIEGVGVERIHRDVVLIRPCYLGVAEIEQRHRSVLAGDFALQHVGNKQRVERRAHNACPTASVAELHQFKVEILYGEALGCHQAECSENHHCHTPHAKPWGAGDLLHQHIYHHKHNQRHDAKCERAKQVVESRKTYDIGIAFTEETHHQEHRRDYAIVAQDIETGA